MENTLNNLESFAKQVWNAQNVESAKQALNDMIEEFAAKKKAPHFIMIVQQTTTLTKCQSLATDFYMQGFDNTKGLSKRI